MWKMYALLAAVFASLTAIFSKIGVKDIRHHLNDCSILKEIKAPFYSIMGQSNASHDELKKHLHAFLMAQNLASRLKTFKGKSPYDFIRAMWTSEPERFMVDPNHFTMGLNSWNYEVTSNQVRKYHDKITDRIKITSS